MEFKKERDLGAIISDTFQFLRENWKDYFLSVIKIIGPVLLIGIALLVFAVVSYTNAAKGLVVLNQAEPSMIMNGALGMFAWIFIMAIIGYLLYVLLAQVSLYYIKSYIENNGVANFDEVKQNTFKNLWNFVGLGILSVLIMMVSYVLCVLPIVYVSVVLSLAMPIMAFEQKSIGDTISHCFTLIKEQWWNTFGVLIVLGLLVGILGVAFSVPVMIYQLVKAGIGIGSEDPTAILDLFDDPIYLGLTFLSYFGRYLFYTITFISSAFIYFDLNEQKNFTGTYEKIENLGQNNTEE